MILFFGGSFNPPHRGHKLLLQELLQIFPRDRIFVAPNFVSPFKSSKEFTSEQILELCSLEFKAELNLGVEVWKYEINKKEISYTIESLQSIQDAEPGVSLGLILGEDNLSEFHNWYKYKEILDLVELLIIFRRFTPPNKLIDLPKYFPEEKTKILNNELWNYSSTEIRKNKTATFCRQVMEKETLDYLLKIGYLHD